VTRGTYAFGIDPLGNIVDSVENLERLRAVFRDERLINGRWGPGDPGDFDHGSWHLLCHLAAAGALVSTSEGRVWLGIGWNAVRGLYEATASLVTSDGLRQLPIATRETRRFLSEARQLAFVEGTSQGHITARGVKDPLDAFNGCPRQMFDHEPN